MQNIKVDFSVTDELGTIRVSQTIEAESFGEVERLIRKRFGKRCVVVHAMRDLEAPADSNLLLG